MSTRRTRLALAVASIAALSGLAGCGSDESPQAGGPSPVASDTTSSPVDPTPSTSSSAPSTSSSTSTAATVTVPVYFVGDTPQGQRLYREFRKVPADHPLAEAVALMVAGDALDPDYSSLYPAGGFQGVSFSSGAGAIVAQVKDDAWASAPPGMSTREAQLAVQQLVYTVQGVQQQRLPVLVQLGNDPAPLFGVDTSQGLTAARPLRVLAFVNITSPEEQSLTSGSFTASGVASSFEGNVPWELRAADGTVVKRGHASAAGFLGKLYPWSTTVRLTGVPSGAYSFVAMTDDESGGEGAGPTVDSKTIMVK